MGKKSIFILLALLTLTIASPFAQRKHKIEDKEDLKKQKEILRLFAYVNQPSYYRDHIDIGNEFKFEGKWDMWTKPECVKDFWYKYQHNFLPRGEIFSVFNHAHLEQAISLFKMFYYTRDYETFYKTAVWARNKVNEGMFVYALSVAVIHRDDMSGVILPPIYEIYPHYFFSNEVIFKAQQYKQHYSGGLENEEMKEGDYKGHTIRANYSGWYINVHPEQSMSYFTEDIGLNAHYYYYSLFYPFWMNGKEFNLHKTRRGEKFYYMHQQLLARYYLERLSNDFGEIPQFEYEYPIETGYKPSLQYSNGIHFPSRPNHAQLHFVPSEQKYPFSGNYSHSYTYIKDYERRLRDAIDVGYVYTPDGRTISLFEEQGFEILGNLIESSPDSPHSRYYGNLQMFARHLLGYSYYTLDDSKLAPSVLEHFETSLRDPMFWQLYRRIMYFFYQYKASVSHHTRKDFTFEGVKIEDVEFDSLITYFDYFYSDLSNAVFVDEKEFNDGTFQVRARQYRLNHKPFSFKIKVDSEKAVEALIKVFIGPKYDEFGRELLITENNWNFVEIDSFHYSLLTGKNTIERNSHQTFYVNDRTSYKEIYQKVLIALENEEEFNVDEMSWGMPNRLLLPKGKNGGQTYQMFVMIAPYHTSHIEENLMKMEEDTFYLDNRYPLGYPFDRPIVNEYEFMVPNHYFKDVTIYHKTEEGDVKTKWSNV